MCLSLSLNKASSETTSIEAAEYCSPAHRHSNTTTLYISLLVHIKHINCRITSVYSMMFIAQKSTNITVDAQTHTDQYLVEVCKDTVASSLTKEA